MIEIYSAVSWRVFKLRKSLGTLQFGRALAAISVLFYHTNITLELPKYIGRDVAPFFNFGYAGVNFFFALSGFVIFIAHEKDIGRREKFLEFFWKRIRRIYPPLWALLIVLVPMLFLVPSFGRRDEMGLWSAVSAFLILPADQNPFLSVEWTLRHEMLFYLVFGVGIWKPRLGMAIGAIWMASSLIVPALGLGYPWSFLFSSCHLLFAFGVVASMAFKGSRVKYPLAVFLAGLILFFGTWWLLFLGLDFIKALGESLIFNVSTVLFGLGAALAILGAAVLERSGTFRLPRTAIFLGEASYAIYLVHYPVVSLTAKLVSKLSPVAPDPVLFGLVVATAAGAGVVFHLVIERPLIISMTKWKANSAASLVGSGNPMLNESGK